MNARAPLFVDSPPAERKAPLRSAVGRLLLHCGSLVIAAACLAAYADFAAEQRPTASLSSLVAAAGFGFLPLRDLVRMFFKIGGTALHLVHAIGGLALVALPLAGIVSGASVLTRSAMAPFAIMGAAQALMHQHQPRNAKQAAAMREFVASLPEVAQIAGSKSVASPESAARAVAALSDIIAKAATLGQTELDADPGFQGALRQVATRFGANLGLDAIDMALTNLAANPVTASAVPGLRKQLAAARRAVAGVAAGARLSHDAATRA